MSRRTMMPIIAQRIMVSERAGCCWTGHTGTVTALATGLVDGRPVAVSGGDDRTVRLCDLITHEETGVPLTFPETIGALAVAPGGLMVCFGFEAAFLTGPISPLRSDQTSHSDVIRCR